MNKSRGGDAPYKRTLKKGNRRKANGTVFKVSLPLTEGPVLLQRTSFSRAGVPLSTADEPPPSQSPIYHWTGTEVRPEDSELHCGGEEGSPLGLQAGREEPSGDAAVGPDSLRVASILSSLVINEGSNDGSDDGSNWGNTQTTRTVWLAEPPQAQSGPDGVGGPLPRSRSEPADDDLWSGRLEHSGGPRWPGGRLQNPETSTGQASCYYRQCLCMSLGGTVVHQAAPCSHTFTYNITEPLPFGGPLAAVGGTAAEPKPTDHNHQWQMGFMPFGPYQAAPQGHAMPATAWCQPCGLGREMTPDQVGQIRPAAPYTAQLHCHSHNAAMWPLR